MAKPLKFGSGEDFDAAVKKAQHFQNKYSSASEIPDSELPDSFDWRNVGDFDFTGEVRDQGWCGSCYIFSFIQVIQSRLQIKYGKEIDKISAQQLMNCNYHSEGCEGGWS